MSIIVKNSGGADFEQLQPGTYRAVCKGVFDIGVQKNEYQGEVKLHDQIIIVFEVDERMTQGECTGERFNMTGWYTKSLHEKATLRKHLESWRGRAFTPEELEGFDVECLAGINCTLSVTLTGGGKSKISSISKMMKGAEKLAIEKPYQDIPEWVQKIKAKAEPIDKKIDEAIESLDNVMKDPYKNDEDIPF